MIYRDDGCLVCECDICGDTTAGVVTGERDWHTFLELIRGDGWASKNVGVGEW